MTTPYSPSPQPEQHLSLEHLAFLIGSWHGLGVLGYADVPESQFEQEMTFGHDGRPFLTYSSQTWLIDDAGTRTGPGPSETGYWRPVPGSRGVEALITHPTGLVEVSVGEVVFHKIELISDLVARTETGDEVTAFQRLYGLVDGDLAYAIDVAAREHSLQAIQSAKLAKVG